MPFLTTNLTSQINEKIHGGRHSFQKQNAIPLLTKLIYCDFKSSCEYWINLCNFLCQTYDLVSKHYNVVQIVRNNNILAFLTFSRLNCISFYYFFPCYNKCVPILTTVLVQMYFYMFIFSYFLYLGACTTHSAFKGFILQAVHL